ncbi:MAG: hypothetical protein AB2815_06660, partial [Candidatus Sedimenticola endophacoides]
MRIGPIQPPPPPRAGARLSRQGAQSISSRAGDQAPGQECRYLVKDFGTSQSPKSTRQRDSRYCP